jgi:hypothetical protein
MKTTLYAATLVLSFTVARAAMKDGLSEHWGELRLSHGLASRQQDDFRLLGWDLPPTVLAGTEVQIEVAWKTLQGDPSRPVCVSLVGEWVPNEALCLIYRGPQDDPGTIFPRRVSFTAPNEPGRYRIRCILAPTLKPILSFHGNELEAADAPTSGFWLEDRFAVSASPSATRPVQAKEAAKPEAKRRDNLAEDRPRARLEVGAAPLSPYEFQLTEWALPKTVRPGQPVQSTVEWRVMHGNRDAYNFATVIGIWDPDKPLVCCIGVTRANPARHFAKPFTFSPRTFQAATPCVGSWPKPSTRSPATTAKTLTRRSAQASARGPRPNSKSSKRSNGILPGSRSL